MFHESNDLYMNALQITALGIEYKMFQVETKRCFRMEQ